MHRLQLDTLSVDSFATHDAAPGAERLQGAVPTTTILVTRGLGCTEYSCYTDCGGATVTICPVTVPTGTAA